MGAIWGERGSGKSSMLCTLRASLAGTAEVRSKLVVVSAADFEPSMLQPQHDDLFAAVLEWLRGSIGGWSDEADAAYETIRKLQAQRRDPDRFLRFIEDVATDTEGLEQDVVEFFGKISNPTVELRAKAQRLFCPRRRYVVFVDDVDLAPELGPQLLTLLFALFGETPLTVLLAADRDLMRRSFRRVLATERDARVGLADKVLAKYVSEQWHLPVPDRDQRHAVVYDGEWKPSDSGAAEPSVRLRAKRVWDTFQPPLYRGVARVSGYVELDRDRYASVEGDEEDEGRPFETHHARALAQQAMPRTWRGVNRLYNRLATLFEQLESRHGDAEEIGCERLFEPLASDVRTRPRNVPAFMLCLLALDESFPALDLYSAFVEDAVELRESLAMLNTSTWSEREDRIAVVANLEFVEPKHRRRAEGLLRRFAWLWQELWQQDRPADRGGETFIALSVRGDAHRIARDWGRQYFDADRRVHWRLGGDPDSQARTSVSQAQAACESIDRELLERVPSGGPLVVLARAPLSVCAYFGHRLVERAVAAVFGSASDSLFALRPAVDLERNGPRVLGVRSGTISNGAAAVVLSVGGSSRASEAPFTGPPGEAGGRSWPEPYVLQSDPRYRIRSAQDVESILSEVLEVADEIRGKGATCLHWGLKCPAALAVLLGQRLRGFAPVCLYEYVPDPESPRYAFVRTIE